MSRSVCDGQYVMASARVAPSSSPGTRDDASRGERIYCMLEHTSEIIRVKTISMYRVKVLRSYTGLLFAQLFRLKVLGVPPW
jgi:hypothetical protein